MTTFPSMSAARIGARPITAVRLIARIRIATLIGRFLQMSSQIIGAAGKSALCPLFPVRRAAGGGSQSQGGDLLGRQTHFRHTSADSNQPAEEYGAVPDERARNLRWRLGSGDVLRGTDPRMPDGGDRGRCGDAGVLGAAPRPDPVHQGSSRRAEAEAGPLGAGTLFR